MRALIIGVFILIVCQSANAQGLGEWFNQKKTQRKYLVEQIAALKVYGGYLKKGYGIAKDGLYLIEDIKDGEFNLHRNYFNSLKEVNPVIKKYPRVKDIMHLHQSILNMVSVARKQWPLLNQLSTGELNYLDQVLDRLLSDCDQTAYELEQVVVRGKLAMKDDERIDRIDTLYGVSYEQYSFARILTGEVNEMAKSRSQEMKGLKDIKLMNGIK
jgi:hypothetical protein